MATKKVSEKSVRIPDEPQQPKTLDAIRIATIGFEIAGDSELICDRLTEEGAQGIADRKPVEILGGDTAWREKLYTDDEGRVGFTSSGLQAALVAAAAYVPGGKTKKLSKKFVAGAFAVMGDVIPITSSAEPRRRSDRVNQNGRPTVRVRAGIPAPWSMTFFIQYNAAIITEVEIAYLVQLAGFHIGIGNWRPEKRGTYGRWHIERTV